MKRKAYEDAEHLKRASDKPELEDAWFEHCDDWADESAERAYLLGVYRDRLQRFTVAIEVARTI